MTKLNENLYELDGQYPLDDLADLLNVPIPETTNHSLGGWIFETLERIPKVGEGFKYENLHIVVQEVDNHRIRKVKVEVLPYDNAEEQS